MQTKKIITLLFIVTAGVVGGYEWYHLFQKEVTPNQVPYENDTPTSTTSEPIPAEPVVQVNPTPPVVEPVVPEVPVKDFFGQDGYFEETGTMGSSPMTDWWLNSGAYFSMKDGIGSTVQGELKKGDKRQVSYRNYDSSETDGGFHPQNIFRLVTKTKWKNFSQECYYKMNRYIVSNDENRSASNGLLLFNRYQDQDNLYYTGLRVDGIVVIKKKVKGDYFLMAQKQVYPGTYGRKKNPNLLPIGRWIGVKSEVANSGNGTVSIKVFLDKRRTGEWQLVATAVDNGKSYGGAVIRNEGYGGIRTDFMDVQFDDYKIEELK